MLEDEHAYLQEAKLKQAFDAAIFRRVGQTVTGVFATKKLPSLNSASKAAIFWTVMVEISNLGGFTVDHQRGLHVLTDGKN